MSPRIYRRPVVSALTGLPTSTIYLRMSQGTFPKPIPLGSPHIVGWIADEVDGWIDEQIRKARGTAPLETSAA
jgi:prophage regulatory protein